MPITLTDRDPRVPADRLVTELVPPPRFADTRFDNYHPDPSQPSQAAAVAALQTFAGQLTAPTPGKSWLRRRSRTNDAAGGIYLDGGFGVGKTHLLASLWHEAPSPKVFATFGELTHLVGALGFRTAIEALSSHRLVCIDEFELDDPGDTVLVSSYLRELAEAGAGLAATSNTLPGKLGEGRFAAQDFLREIQGLADRFEVHRIDGPDYRHRGLPEPPEPVRDDELVRRAEATHGAALDDFADVCAHLQQVHPSRFGGLLDGVSAVLWSGVTTLDDQATALRLVVLADRLYDRDIPVLASGVRLDRLFAPELLAGGYRKKYFRAISRLTALARESSSLGQ